MAVIRLAKYMQKILDPHLHFFDLAKGRYAWLKAQNPPFWPDKHIISKKIVPNQLSVNSDFTFVGGVHIEAGFDNEIPQNELHWLENNVYSSVPNQSYKSIAYADITKPHLVFCKDLSFLLSCRTFAGIRCIIDDNTPNLGALVQIYENVKFLENAGIILEVQLSLSDDFQAHSLLKIIASVAKLKVVINHAGLPPAGLIESISGMSKALNQNNELLFDEVIRWKNNLADFAQLPNCFIKCSGFEMQNRNYTKQHVLEVLSIVHELFGKERVMLASNFPLTLLSKSYAAYWQLLYDVAKNAHFSSEHLMYLNTKNLYGF